MVMDFANMIFVSMNQMPLGEDNLISVRQGRKDTRQCEAISSNIEILLIDSLERVLVVWVGFSFVLVWFI
mgnify:CR=1 FL=1